MSSYDTPSDAGGRTYVPKKRKPPPKKRVVSPDDRSLPRATPPQQKPAPQETHGITPLPRPVPVLQNYGFNGSIDDFVKRLHEGVDAFSSSFGYKPTPALAFDLARYPGPHTFESLFSHPATQQEADSVNAQNSNEPPLLKPLRAAAAPLTPAQRQEALHKQYPSVAVGRSSRQRAWTTSSS